MASGEYSTFTTEDAKFTEAEFTPYVLSKACSTVLTQDAQCIPFRVNRALLNPGAGTLLRPSVSDVLAFANCATSAFVVSCISISLTKPKKGGGWTTRLLFQINTKQIGQLWTLERRGGFANLRSY